MCNGINSKWYNGVAAAASCEWNEEVQEICLLVWVLRKEKGPLTSRQWRSWTFYSMRWQMLWYYKVIKYHKEVCYVGTELQSERKEEWCIDGYEGNPEAMIWNISGNWICFWDDGKVSELEGVFLNLKGKETSETQFSLIFIKKSSWRGFELSAFPQWKMNF